MDGIKCHSGGNTAVLEEQRERFHKMFMAVRAVASIFTKIKTLVSEVFIGFNFFYIFLSNMPILN